VLLPAGKGTYERRRGPEETGPNSWRDMLLAWPKDVGRALDYLETRPDIDSRRVGYYGLSLGAAFGPVVAAVEPRLRALVLVGDGLDNEEIAPEVDQFNYAPHVRAPVLMINGSHDFLFPPETSQEPLFRLFTMPDDQKRHYVFEGGHVPPRMQEVARETLDWLDRHLGPVASGAGH